MHILQEVMMPWSSKHVGWLKDTGDRLETADGKDIEVWEFHHEDCDEVLSAWARHFRNHYCADTEIDYLRKGIKCSRADYLRNIKFPDEKAAPGPSIRAGDFGEVLVADFLEYVWGYWVPRMRYSDKSIRNESTKGSDIIGMHFVKDGKTSPKDTLAIFEAKTQFTGKKLKPRLQDAVDGSAKDYARKAESLNYIKQQLFRQNKLEDAERIERFQNETDNPYRELHGAAALLEGMLFDTETIRRTVTTEHSNAKNLTLLVIKGAAMMSLVHELYRRAADEA